MTERDLKELLDTEASRINSKSFIDDDPVRFPRQFTTLQDIEIASLLSATIAWGNRKMICRDCERLMALTDYQPYAYMMDEGYEDLSPEMNIHRTFFARNLQHYLRGLRRIYSRYGSLQEYGRAIDIATDEAPAWRLVEGINHEIAEANDGTADSRCLPQNMRTTAIKRVNMALRWLVRNDGIVDMGVWDVIRPSQLYIPLDVHVGDTARELSLVSRKANDRRTVNELTERLRMLRPDDPVFYDYALFGIGMRL